MSQLENLKKKLKCEKCGESYSEIKRLLFLNHVNIMCVQSVRYLLTLLSMYETSEAKSAEEKKKLRDENEDLRNKILKSEKEGENHHRCSECQKSDSELDMVLCATCHGLKFKDHEDVKKKSLCSTCAIKKHLRKGHQIVDFYPYLSAYNFSAHSSKIESQSEGVKNSRASLNNTISLFNALSISVSEKHNVLIDMARRSKSTRNQLEFIEKIETFSNESKSIHVGADSELKERTKMLQESLTKLTNWCNARTENCVDDSETFKLEASATHDDNDSDIGSIECIQDVPEC